MTDTEPHFCDHPNCTNPVPRRDNEWVSVWRKRKYCSPECGQDVRNAYARAKPRKDGKSGIAAVLDLPVFPDAACAGKVSVFDVPENGQMYDGQLTEAKRICGGCPSALPCLTWALTHKEIGIWAGTTEAKREQIRRDRIHQQVAA